MSHTSFPTLINAEFTDHALGQYEKGYELAQALYEGLTDYERRSTSHWATAAAWHMVSSPT